MLLKGHGGQASMVSSRWAVAGMTLHRTTRCTQPGGGRREARSAALEPAWLTSLSSLTTCIDVYKAGAQLISRQSSSGQALPWF